jgi:putative membrane protein
MVTLTLTLYQTKQDLFERKNMELLQKILVGFVAFLHLGFLYLEMFLWKTPTGLKIFRLDAEFAERSAVLAANQGLYNGFLAAGLIWSLCSKNVEQAFALKIFFLTCVLVAGIYGALTASKNILFLQALPAAIALAVVYFK